MITSRGDGRSPHPASLRVWDVHLEEVLSNPDIREDLLRMLQDRRRVLVPRTQMGQHEQPTPGLFRGFRGLTRGRVAIAVRFLLECRIRGRVVDEDVRMARHLDERLVRHRVARLHDPAPASWNTTPAPGMYPLSAHCHGFA